MRNARPRANEAAADLAIDGDAVRRIVGRTSGRHVGEALRWLAAQVKQNPQLNTPDALTALLTYRPNPSWRHDRALDDGHAEVVSEPQSDAATEAMPDLDVQSRAAELASRLGRERGIAAAVRKRRRGATSVANLFAPETHLPACVNARPAA
jgi:hypothetical protein